MKKVLLFGPVLGSLENAYGGGTGGYTRKMLLYLRHFHSDKFSVRPCFHTVKGQYRYGFFVVRLLIDIWRFTIALIREKPDIVHILAQYRRAAPREFAIVWLSKLFGKKVVYEIKAGVFHTWYPAAGRLMQALARYCLRHSDAILCQGYPFMEFIEKNFGLPTVYYPNFMAENEITGSETALFQGPNLRLLFVGYAFREKGVFELVEACRRVAARGIGLELTLVGKEHPEFQAWLDQNLPELGFAVHRPGVLPHEEVLGTYASHDLYVYPTRHGGEGHNNTINEAMMNGLIILCTRQGFLGSILKPEFAYLLDSGGADELESILVHIHHNREEAREKGALARKYFLSHFTSQVAFGKLEKVYSSILT